MLLSFGFLGPVHWLARFRGNRRRDNNTRDVAAVIIIVLLVVGAARSVPVVSVWPHMLLNETFHIERSTKFMSGHNHSQNGYSYEQKTLSWKLISH
jgi:hypothetical protein